LKVDGTVVAWGALTNVPPGLSNVMNIAAGESHAIALKNDGTVVAWGDNSFGQTNAYQGLNKVKLIAGGGDFSAAIRFNSFVFYTVDVTKDLLLLYNSSSSNSTALKDYYLSHRPLVANANVLAVSCETNESTTASNCDAEIVNPVLDWLTNNPTKHPCYIILFFDMPTRIQNYNSTYPSVTLRLYSTYPGIPPFITYINGGTLADCEGYIDKLSSIGATYSPGRLLISAGPAGYSNTNYYFDNTGYIATTDNVSGLNASNSVVLAGASPQSAIYTNVSPDIGLQNHITSGNNVAGYLCMGVHSSLGADYAINGMVRWSGNSGWWLIETVESFNGQRSTDQGNFIKWFSSNAFGGTGYSNTPVGAVCHVEEPYEANVNDASLYFGLWTAGKNFAICAWKSRITSCFQAVGDPFVMK
jgi:hypothetical protein